MFACMSVCLTICKNMCDRACVCVSVCNSTLVGGVRKFFVILIFMLRNSTKIMYIDAYTQICVNMC